MTHAAQEIRDKLFQRLIPALPVPFRADRTIDHDSHVRMADYYLDQSIGGVAIWAHTGRGLMLTREEREEVLTHWRESLPQHVIVAGAGCPATNDPRSDQEYINGAREMAAHAKLLGADAILCYAPSRFRERTEKERDTLIMEYHAALASAGLPMILFYLYEAAGGVRYGAELLRKLLAMKEVVGIKMATLDSVVTFQNTARLVREEFPNHLLITGEDRFLGYSLMMGANSALVGMGTALTELQVEMMQAFYHQDLDNFQFRSSLVDHFGQATFGDPTEGYIARMLYTLAELGIISSDAITDPWGPDLPESDFSAIDEFLATVPVELKR